jgi:tRNA1(Val) A37 N6-methylase TrmN6
MGIVMDLMTNERIDYVNDKLSLIQKVDGLTFGTDALLLAGYINGRYANGVEIGGGSGIISMLLLTREKVGAVRCIEVQEEYAELIGRNAELNSLSERLTPVCSDVRKYKPEEEYDIVFTNPPYMKSTSGAHNEKTAKTVARHEIFGDIRDFCHSGARLLKFGGTFAVVYRPDRLIDLIAAMRGEGIEPKRMTFVHADTDSEPSMVLIEGKRGGKSGLMLTKPLIIYKDKNHKEYGEDMEYIMENGSFPAGYKR